MNSAIVVLNRLPVSWRLWAGCLFLLLLASSGYAQSVGDYRSIAGGAASFVNKNSWERWNGSSWVNNTAALNYARTFTVLHAKNIPAAGLGSTVAKIVVQTDAASGSVGVLNVNGPVVCTALEVKGVGAHAVVKHDNATIGRTDISSEGLVTLVSDASLGNVTVTDYAELELITGVSTATVVGPVTVQDGGTLSVTANGPTLQTLTVASGGQALISGQVKLVKTLVEAGGILVQQASGQIQVVHDASASVADLVMKGQLRNESNTASVNVSGGAQMTVQAGATYTHSANGGQLPICTWDPASTLEITGVVDASGFTNDNQVFGNIVWNTPDYGTSSSGNNVFYLNGSGNMRVAGKLTVRDTGIGRLQLTPGTGSGSLTTRLGAFELQGGQVCVARYGSMLTRTVTIDNDFTLSSGRFELSNSSSSGAGVLNVNGVLRLNGGTLQLTGGALTGTINLGSDLELNSGSDLRREVAAGAATVNFAGTQVQRFSQATSASITGVVNFAVLNGATLDMSTQVLESDGDFVLNAGATLLIGHNQGIAAKTPVATASTGNIQVKGARTFNTDAAYIYNGNSTQQTGNGLPATLTTASTLGLRNSSGVVTLTRATSLAGKLQLRQGRLLTTTNALTLTPTATWTEASDASYVDGQLLRQTNSNALVYTFPVGAGGKLKVGGVRPTASSSATFRMVPYVAPAPDFNSLAPGANLFTVSRREYWEVSRTSGSANATVRLYYTVPYSDVQESTAAQQQLRIAAYTGGQWQNYGQATVPNTAEKYLDAGQILALTTGTAVPVTFGSASPLNPLPVILTQFTAKLVGKEVQLNWRTAQEKDCAGFEVQASDNGTDFQVLHYYNGRGTTAVATDYAHLDASAFRAGPRVRYYRLRQIDTDGRHAYSQVAAVAAPGKDAATFAVWPVPTREWLNIELSPKEQKDVTIRVIDNLGRLCQMQKYSASDVPAVARLSVDQLHRGLYFVQVETKLRRVQVRFQKE